MPELIVKVDPKRAASAARHVRRILEALGVEAPTVAIEEVFPGLRTGRSAGLVSIEIPAAWPAAARRAFVGALKKDPAIEYVQEPKPRRPL